MKLLKKTLLAASALTAASAFSPVASAALIIEIKQGATTITVTDGGGTDGNPSAGSVSYFNSSINGYNIIVFAARQDDPNFAQLTETSILLSCNENAQSGTDCSGGASIQFRVYEDAFTYGTNGDLATVTSTLAASSLTAGSASLISGVGGSGVTGDLGTQSGLGTLSASGTDIKSFTATLADPSFKMYNILTVTNLGSGTATLTATTYAQVPAAGGLFSLGGALLGLGLIRRRQMAR